MQIQETECKNHNILLDCRKLLSIGGVKDVISFDEFSILLDTEGGKLLVEGENLSISALDVESGKLTAQGRIDSMTYEGTEKKNDREVFAKIFK